MSPLAAERAGKPTLVAWGGAQSPVYLTISVSFFRRLSLAYFSSVRLATVLSL